MPQLCCPRCGSAERQVKAGINTGRQQYRCGACGRRYVFERKARGYSLSLREQAALLRTEGQTLAQIAETLGMSPRTLRNWFRASDVPANPAQHSLQGRHSEAASQPDGRPHLSDPAKADVRRFSTSTQAVRTRVTILDVASRAGVAPSTVSNYLNDKGRMNEKTRQRIREAVDALHFTPNALTKAIRSRQTRILGVVVYGIWDFVISPTFSVIPPLLAGINRSAEASGHDVLMYTSWHTRGSHGGIRFLDGHIDGLLLTGSTVPDPVVERTAATGLPIVALMTRRVPATVGYVTIDNNGGMGAIVEHLVSVGHRRIGYVGPLHDSDHVDRYHGFRQAMASKGLAWDASLMEIALRAGTACNYDMVLGDLLPQLVQMADTLDAIVTPTDWLAARAVEQLAARGLRVPDDIAVTGFDDVLEAKHIACGLTTIRQPFHTIGQLAVERLLAMIDGAPVSECRITVPAELVVRASTSNHPSMS